MKAINYVIVITVAGCLSGCSSRTNGKKTLYDEVIKVRVSEIGVGDISTSLTYIGLIEESQSVPLSFSIMGSAEQVLVTEGQSVQKGQLLAVLNDATYRNALQIAESTEKQAQDAFNRLEPVYKKGSLPEIKFVEVKTALEKAKSMFSISQKNLNDCRLYAPSSGIIGKKSLEPGMNVAPGVPAFHLVKIDNVNASIPIPENEISTIKKGQRAVVKVSATGDKIFEGEVTEVGVLSNPLSHTYTVKILLRNQDHLLKPGMVCSINLDNQEMADRIIIPMSAVQTDGDGNRFVFVTNQDKAVKKSVTTGPLASNGVVITSGLNKGDKLIVSGYQKISDGTLVSF